jgi:PAS domain S-box-containing protein
MKNNSDLMHEKYQPGQVSSEIAMIARLSQIVLHENDLSVVINRVVELVLEALSCTVCRLLILEPETNTLLVAASVGNHGLADGQAFRFPRANTLADLALEATQPVVLETGQCHPQQPKSGLPGEPDVKGISVALTGQEGAFGAFETYIGPERTVEAWDIYLTQIAANILSAAIDRGQADREIGLLDSQLVQKLTERTEWLNLLSEATIAANEAATVTEVMQTVLTKICSYTRWPVGHVLIPDKDGPASLQPTPIWFTRDPERYQSFIQATKNMRFPLGASLPGKVYELGKPVWEMDISREGFLRATEAEQTGLKAGFAFPVLVQKEVAAVMEFFTDQAISPDQPLLAVVANIGIQVGRVIERRRAQEEIQNNQRQLEEAHRIARLGTWEWNMLANQLIWSNRLLELYGLDAAEFNASYEEFLARVHPDDRNQVAAMIQHVADHPGPFEYQHRIVRQDGEIRVLHIRGDVITDPEGTPVKMFGTGQDITRRKQMEDELHAREELLHTVITAAPIILWAVDRQGTITLLEGMALASLGANAQDLLGKSITEVLGNRAELLEYIRRALAGEQVVAEMEIESSVFETRFAPMLDKNKEIVGVTGVSIDISSRIKAEAARRASDARFRTIFEDSAMGIGIINLEHQILVCNPVLRQMLNLTSEEIQQKRMEDLVHPRDRAKSKLLIENLLSGHGTLMQQEVRFLCKDRTPIWVNLSGSLVRNPSGTPNFAITMLEDITGRKQIEAELIEVQQQLVAGREEERRHLAQEIHDDPLQSLYGLMFQLDSVREETKSEQGLTEIREMQTNINQVIDSLRTICSGLRPPTLMPFGLEVSIREHAESFQKEHPELTVYLDLMYDGQTLSEHIRLTLYRIYQQALSNVVRHAQASHVTIRFRFNERQAELIVEDNGHGFTVPSRWVELVRQNHMGLAGSAERVEILGGRFKVVSSPEKGTRIEASVPRPPINSEDDQIANSTGKMSGY